MLDLMIRGGTVVTPHGAGRWDVGIAAGKIVAVAAPEALGGVEAGRTLDAGGKIVFPGGIDPHIHCSWPVQPGAEGAPPVLSAGPAGVSRAALFGGTTTLIDFAVWNPGEALEQTIARRERDWRGQCHCDYAYHVMLQGKIPARILGELAEVIQAGFSTVKIFTTDIRPTVKGRRIGYGDIWEILRVTAREGGLAAIHAEEDDLVMHLYEKLTGEGRVGFENMAEVHSALSEDLSFRHVIRLAENVEDAALYMMHVSVMYTEMVVKRGYPLERFVEFVSTNAARIMGLYPRKGVIAVGADADLVIFDPSVRRKVRVEDLHETDYSPWEGHEVAGWPETTILRGRIIVAGGEFLGEARGERIPRRISDSIRAGPAC